MDNTFEVLKAIMSSNNLEKREEFIRQNSQKIVPLFRWLCNTVVLLETQNYDDEESTNDDDLNQKPKKSRRINFEQQSSTINILENIQKNDENKERNDLLQFSLDCILIISSAVTSSIFDNDSVSDDSMCICQAVVEESTFLRHLNNKILNNKAISSFSIDRHLGILVNFTRQTSFIDSLVKNILWSFPLKDFLSKFLEQFLRSNLQKSHRHLLAAYLNNLCQSEKVLCFIVESKFLLSLFQVYDQSKNDVQLRRYLIELVRNCCLDYTFHRQMISQDDPELLVRLVLPLAGGEELADEEMESLPLDLQYLPVDKEREQDPEIRLLLIEAIHQLCTTRYGRELIREMNIYYHLREYHRWESVPKVSETLMRLIDLIIKKEDEIQVDNLRELFIPDDLVEKFEQLDDEMMKDSIHESTKNIQRGKKVEKF